MVLEVQPISRSLPAAAGISIIFPSYLSSLFHEAQRSLFPSHFHRISIVFPFNYFTKQPAAAGISIVFLMSYFTKRSVVYFHRISNVLFHEACPPRRVFLLYFHRIYLHYFTKRPAAAGISIVFPLYFHLISL